MASEALRLIQSSPLDASREASLPPPAALEGSAAGTPGEAGIAASQPQPSPQSSAPGPPPAAAPMVPAASTTGEAEITAPEPHPSLQSSPPGPPPAAAPGSLAAGTAGEAGITAPRPRPSAPSSLSSPLLAAALTAAIAATTATGEAATILPEPQTSPQSSSLGPSPMVPPVASAAGRTGEVGITAHGAQPSPQSDLSPRAVALLEAAAAADQAGQPAIALRIQSFIPLRKATDTDLAQHTAAGGQLSSWARPLLSDPRLIPFSAEHLTVMAKLWDDASRELQAREQNPRATETPHPGSDDRRQVLARLATLHTGQETIMAVRSFRQRFPTAWTQSHPLRAAAAAALSERGCKLSAV